VPWKLAPSAKKSRTVPVRVTADDADENAKLAKAAKRVHDLRCMMSSSNEGCRLSKIHTYRIHGTSKDCAKHYEIAL
jgi:hypothetical protein